MYPKCTNLKDKHRCTVSIKGDNLSNNLSNYYNIHNHHVLYGTIVQTPELSGKNVHIYMYYK
jgi:hypothetical protein